MNSKARRVSVEDGISFSDDIILTSEGSEKEGEASSSSFKRMRRTRPQDESSIHVAQGGTSMTSLKRRVSLEQATAAPAKRVKMSAIAVQTDLSWLNHHPSEYPFPAEQPPATKKTFAQECHEREPKIKTITPSPSLLSVPGMHFATDDNIAAAGAAADTSTFEGWGGESIMDPPATGLDLEDSLGSSSASIESSMPEEVQDSPARQVEDLSSFPPAISFVECRPTLLDNLQELQRGLFLALQVEHNAPSPTQKIGFSASTTAASLSVLLYDILLLVGMVLLVFTVLQVWDLHTQYSNQLSFSGNDCIYVTVSPSCRLPRTILLIYHQQSASNTHLLSASKF